MQISDTLKRRISRTFLLQAAAISIAAVVSVLLAAGVIKHVLVTEALRMEADYFWARRATDPAFPLPDTRNLTGHLAAVGSDAGLPAELHGIGDGFHEVASGADFTTVYATSRGPDRLYLVFDGERVDELAAYFGLVPLVIVLLVLYLSVWLTFRASQRAVSPIISLAREVNRLDPDTDAIAAFDVSRLASDADQEVRTLVAALDGLARRVEDFVERERAFTRDASHELRTPLTVIRVATDVLLERDGLEPRARTGVERIRRSCNEMEHLVEGFLLLARESDRGLPNELVCVNDVVAAEIERLRLIAADKPVDIEVHPECRLLAEAPNQAVSVVVGNLLRNAFSYTERGRVGVRIGSRGVLIEDSGIGMDPSAIEGVFAPFVRGSGSTPGHGVGLTIVRRFCDRYGWTLQIDSEPGVGTKVLLRFPRARCQS